MKLITALELAEESGLEIMAEAIFNVYLHAASLFVWGRIGVEYDEMVNEWHALRDRTEFTSDSPIRDVLAFLRKELEG